MTCSLPHQGTQQHDQQYTSTRLPTACQQQCSAHPPHPCPPSQPPAAAVSHTQDYFRDVTQEDVAALVALAVDPATDPALRVPALPRSKLATAEAAAAQAAAAPAAPPPPPSGRTRPITPPQWAALLDDDDDREVGAICVFVWVRFVVCGGSSPLGGPVYMWVGVERWEAGEWVGGWEITVDGEGVCQQLPSCWCAYTTNDGSNSCVVT